MTRFNLLPHNDFPPAAVRGVVVALSFAGSSRARLAYRVKGAERLVLPPQQPSTRTDALWRTTCFELLLMLDDGERYVEFNFSPSTRWAAYAFDGYREGMADLARDVPPQVERREGGVAVALDLGGLPRGELSMALTAVIEEQGGVKSYWSLAHPPGAPDFHHAACFAARLPAPDAA